MATDLWRPNGGDKSGFENYGRWVRYRGCTENPNPLTEWPPSAYNKYNNNHNDDAKNNVDLNVMYNDHNTVILVICRGGALGPPRSDGPVVRRNRTGFTKIIHTVEPIPSATVGANIGPIPTSKALDKTPGRRPKIPRLGS